MPLTSKGNKVLAAMRKEYGSKKGESVFYASKNKGTLTGVDDAGEEISGVGAESWVGKRSNSTGYRITAADAQARIAKFVGDYGLPTPRGVDQSGTGKYHFAGQPNHATGDAFEEGKHPRGEGGKFAGHASVTSKAAEHHAAEAAKHTASGNKQLAVSHTKAAGSYRQAAAHYSSGQEQAAHEVHSAGNAHARTAMVKENRAAGRTVNRKIPIQEIAAAHAKGSGERYVAPWRGAAPVVTQRHGLDHAIGDAQDRPLQELMDYLSAKLIGPMPNYGETRDRLLGDAATIVRARPPGPRQITTRPTPQPNAATRQSNIVTARSPQEIAKSRASSTAGATTWNSRTQQGTRPSTDDDADASAGASFHERQAAHFTGRGQQDIAMRHTKAAALLHKAAAARLGGQVEAQRHTQAAAKIANPVVRPTGDRMPAIKGQNPRFAQTYDRWMNAPTRDQATIGRFMDKHRTTRDDDMGGMSAPPTDMGSPTTSDYGVRGMKKGYHMHTPPRAAPRRKAKPSPGIRMRFKGDEATDDAAAPVVETRKADIPGPMAWARDTISKFVAKRARA